MSDDEHAMLVVSALAALLLWVWWAWLVIRPSWRAGSRGSRMAALPLPPLVAVLGHAALARIAAHDVRDSTTYLLFYDALGAFAVAVVVWILPLLGLNWRDDIAERGNQAATWALAGALGGTGLCYLGGNAGDGPGWPVVAFSSGLATSGWLLLWAAFDRVTRISESVSVDRDVASGIRLAGYLLGTGAMLGRAVAGDWVSASATVDDFAALAWPALVLAAAAAVVEPWLRPSPAQAAGSPLAHGLLPAAAYVGAAGVWIASRGPWS